jgi:hypothetical protein
MLSKHETDSIFTGLEYPVFRAWQYTDKGGFHYLLLMEKYARMAPKDTITTNIAAVCLMKGDEKDKQLPVLRWKMKDQLDPDERSIWFWTKYVSLKDIDGDGYTDPLIIYGTSPKEDGDDHRRLKMLLYYRYRKVAVRAVTGTLDFERSLQYDAAFKTLPAAIQSYMKQLLQKISEEQDFILASPSVTSPS